MAETRNVYADRPGVAPALVENDTRIIRKIPVCFLDEPLNPMRHDMDDDKLQDLMNDIRQHGLLQNLCVVPILDWRAPRLRGYFESRTRCTRSCWRPLPRGCRASPPTGLPCN